MMFESHRSVSLSRTAVIVGYAERAIRETDLGLNSFAMAVVPRYRSLVPKHQQHIGFSNKPDVVDAARVDGQKLKRFIDGTNRLPAELEEAWVLSLPEPYRRDCIRELAWRYGLVGAFAEPVLEATGKLKPECLARLTKEFSEVVSAAGAAIGAGLNEAGRAQAAKELRDLKAEVVTMLARLDA